MDFLLGTDLVPLLSRIQFAGTVAFHFIFVPLSIGLGLIMALNETRAYRSGKPEDKAATKLWVKIFTGTFVVGVATGITMEFSFGTNWAEYSRFVGDIFGAPLAAEALFSFFLESVFLGVLVFGRNKVSPKFYMVSAWLVFFGATVSALWILIANSWMQTPAGAELGAQGIARLTDFWAAALNPSIFARYTHTVNSALINAAFISMAIAAWYLLKGRNQDFAMKTLRTGAVVAIITGCAMLYFAHASAVVVAEEQPTKFAMMEGMYGTEGSTDKEVADLYLGGWVDEANGKVLKPFAIPGGVSWLASWDGSTEYDTLYGLAASGKYGSDFTAETVKDLPVNLVFQTYHIMVIMYGLIMICAILALIFSFGKGKIAEMKWLQRLLLIAPVFPFIAMQTGWIVAEVGRQPWIVYPAESSATLAPGVSMLTNDGVSAISHLEILVTMVLFLVVYLFLFIAWGRVMTSFIKKGPVVEEEVAKGGE